MVIMNEAFQRAMNGGQARQTMREGNLGVRFSRNDIDEMGRKVTKIVADVMERCGRTDSYFVEDDPNPAARNDACALNLNVVAMLANVLRLLMFQDESKMFPDQVDNAALDAAIDNANKYIINLFNVANRGLAAIHAPQRPYCAAL